MPYWVEQSVSLTVDRINEGVDAYKFNLEE
jgi:hypothetical protein